MAPKAKAAAAKSGGKAGGRALNRLYCIWCGAQSKLSEGQGGLPDCARCKKPAVDGLALLGALGQWSGDLNDCGACGTKNALWHKSCFACGAQLGG